MMKYIFCALLSLYSIFIMHTVFSMEKEGRTITFFNHNVPNLSIQFRLLRPSEGTYCNTTHPLKKGKKKKWDFTGLKLLEKPKLIIQQEDSQPLIFKFSNFDTLLKSKHTITIHQYDDSVVVAVKKGKKAVSLSILLQQEASLSASR